MSSFIVTPFRVRRPSTRPHVSGRNARRPAPVPAPVSTAEPEPPSEPEITINNLADSYKELSLAVTSVTQELHSIKERVNTNEAYIKTQGDTMDDMLRRLNENDSTLKDIQTENEQNADIMRTFEKLHKQVNTKEETPTVKMLLSRMESLESNTDRLINTLSRLSDPPKIQRRVAGSGITPELSENIQFGRIQKITT